MDGAPKFGRYKVTGTLGSGAMGDVYAAEDEVLGRKVAVKTLRSTSSGHAARMIDERFRLEARAVASLNHPAIVQVYDLDLAADPPYLVMERMAGPSLKDRLAAGPMTEGELRELGIQIARALATAHAAGIVHRDVKPANILGAGPRTWKLVDFGVAHVPDSSLTMTGQFIGSPAYAPPEALLRGQCTPAGDVFGLGATLYYGAVGRWPRADANATGLLAPLPPIRMLAPQLPEELATILDRAVDIEPERRPTAIELAEALAGAPLAAAPLVPARAASPVIETEFVPDATRASSPPPRLASPPPAPVDTVFVADTTGGRPGRRWKPWAIAGAVVAAILVIAVATRDRTPAASPGAGSDAGPVADAGSVEGSAETAEPADSSAASETPPPSGSDTTEEPPLEPPPPGQIRALTPPIHDRRAAKEWEKIIDALYDHELRKARDRLADWEQRWGETRETRDLRQQLDTLVPSDD